MTCIVLLTSTPPFELMDTSIGGISWKNYLDTSVAKSSQKILDRMIESGTLKRYRSAHEVLQEIQDNSNSHSGDYYIPKSSISKRYYRSGSEALQGIQDSSRSTRDKNFVEHIKHGLELKQQKESRGAFLMLLSLILGFGVYTQWENISNILLTPETPEISE